MANRMQRNPLEVMQALYIVHGKPSFSSSFLTSLINSCGYYEPLRFRFEGQGDSRSCMAWTVDKRTGETVEGPKVSIQMAKDEGWYSKNGSKWKTMPEVMLRYRAASFFSRAYCPDLTGGFHSSEEVQDAGRSESPAQVSSNSELEAELLAQSKPVLTKPKEAEPYAPIDPEMMDFGPAAEPEPAPQEAAKSHPAPATEVERLRESLSGVLAINFTDAEAAAWIEKNYGPQNTLGNLTKAELKGAISKINAEMDARELGI
jgi:hypothetical protein